MAASLLTKLRRKLLAWASADYSPHATPSVLQMEAQECGAACLAMVLAHYGRHESLADLRIACGVSRDGCKASNILRTARSLGMYAKGLSASAEEVRQMPCPLIIFWQFNHFLVLEGFAKGRAWLNDPARGRRNISEAEFDAGFTGVVLVCEPGAGFEKNYAARTVLQQIVQRWQAFRLERRDPATSHAQADDQRVPQTPFSKFFDVSLNSSASLLGRVLLLGAARSLPGVLLASLAIVIFDDRLGKFLHHAIAAHQSLHEVLGVLPGWWAVPLLLVLFGFLQYAQWRATLLLQGSLARRWSSDFLQTLIALPLAFFQQRFAGELAQRVASNQTLARILVGDFLSFASNAFAALVCLLALAQLNLSMAGLGLSFCLLHLAVIGWSQQRGFAARQEFQLEQDQFLAHLRQGTQQIERLKLAGAEAMLFQNSLHIHAKLIRQEQILGRLRILTETWPLALSLLFLLLILLPALLALVQGTLSMGMLLGLLILAANLNLCLLAMRGIESKLQTFKLIVARLDDVLQHAPQLAATTTTTSTITISTTAAAARHAPIPAAEIQAQYVGARLQITALDFAYAPFAPLVLQNISLELAPGQQLALLGPSASGKSTLAKLIAGLLSLDACSPKVFSPNLSRADERENCAASTGQIILDDQVLLGSSRPRTKLAMLQQQPYLPDSALSELERLWQQQGAACMCLLKELDLLNLLEGRQAWHARATFSLGERQRLALASAILSRPGLLILDQACSALELGLQKKVLLAIRRRGITCLLISQSMGWLRECEQIILLDAGKIQEQGTHQELLAKRGQYFALCVADQASDVEGGYADK